ncbi:chemotaxis protein CheC [Fredinandcohnia quinoae]|uniref:Chemotaxis protein CheC n=1 Tax=Fredinandcohnia quinoae TaxID=2918902 RepID=A0AAW5DSY5_9BACI|nr:chemotaxis protein CheC [Fredinandcohnia sp. SECRCQ15]MCH1623761.1 chemotaxis protein CheC [Fredinandcohnia sp. SECRCQ15]
MSFLEQINSTHIDILKEIGNIGAGHSATALSKLLNKKINMNVPDVKIVSFEEMMELVGGPDNIVASVFLRIEGDVPGNMFFILQLNHANKLIQEMIGDSQFSFDNPSSSELGFSAFQELGNILSGSYLSSLSDFTNLNMFPSVPALSVDMFGAIIGYGLIELSQVSDYAIVIDTAINENEKQDKENIYGHFFLLPDPDSFDKVFKALGVLSND